MSIQTVIQRVFCARKAKLSHRSKLICYVIKPHAQRSASWRNSEVHFLLLAADLFRPLVRCCMNRSSRSAVHSATDSFTGIDRGGAKISVLVWWTFPPAGTIWYTVEFYDEFARECSWIDAHLVLSEPAFHTASRSQAAASMSLLEKVRQTLWQSVFRSTERRVRCGTSFALCPKVSNGAHELMACLKRQPQMDEIADRSQCDLPKGK